MGSEPQKRSVSEALVSLREEIVSATDTEEREAGGGYGEKTEGWHSNGGPTLLPGLLHLSSS